MSLVRPLIAPLVSALVSPRESGLPWDSEHRPGVVTSVAFPAVASVAQRIIFAPDYGTIDTGAFSALADQSGGGYNLAQGTASLRPLSTTLSGRQTAELDGVDDRMPSAANLSTIAGSTAWTIFSVFQLKSIAAPTGSPWNHQPIWSTDNALANLIVDSTNGLRAHCFGGSGAGHTTAGIAASTGVRYLACFRWSGTTLSLRVNDVALDTISPADTVRADHTLIVEGLGAAGTAPAAHYAFERVVCNASVSAGDETLLRAYFKSAYGLTLTP